MDAVPAGPGRRKVLTRNVVLAVVAQGILVGALVLLFNEPAPAAVTLTLLPDALTLDGESGGPGNVSLRLHALLAIPAGSHLPLDEVQVRLSAPGNLLDDGGDILEPWCQATTMSGLQVLAVTGPAAQVAPFSARALALLQGVDGPSYGGARALPLQGHDNGYGPGVGLGYGASTPGPDLVQVDLALTGCLAPSEEPLGLQVQLAVGAPGALVRSLPVVAYVEARPGNV